jgi:hypothetical protein
MARIFAPALAILSLSLSLPAAAGNLVVGGNAGLCTRDLAAATTIPGWEIIDGSPSLLCPALTGGTRPAISGGPYRPSTLRQTIDLGRGAAAIDAGGQRFTLAARLGRLSDPALADGMATLTLQFRDANETPLGEAVSLAGSDEPAAKSAGAAIPAGARSAVLTLELSGANGAGGRGVAADVDFETAVPLATPALVPPPASVPAFDHVFLIVMENTNYEQVMGNPVDAPYIAALVKRGTLLRRYDANYHPSDQNYLAIAGGDSFVKGGIYFPKLRLGAANLADRLEAAGKSWKAYEQGMGTPCNTTTKFDRYYQPDDAPFGNFADIIGRPARCKAHLFDTAQLPVDLGAAATTPNFGWIAADDYYDGEAAGNDDGMPLTGSPVSLQVQDAWLKATLEPLFASPAWQNERSLLILTWDESLIESSNHIVTLLVGSQGLVKAGAVSDVHYDHYSTARTIEAALGLQPLTDNDRYARPINDAFAR